MDRVLSTLSSPTSVGPGPFRRLLQTVAMKRSRHRLSELDDHMLRDIGLTREQASREAAKVCWDAPAHWFR